MAAGEHLDPVEERVRQFLIERASTVNKDKPFSATVTYGDLCEAVDPERHHWTPPRFRGIGGTLGRVSTFEEQQGRPLLSALVVRAGSHQAGEGFASLARQLGRHLEQGREKAFWRNEVEQVVRYWSEGGPEPVETANDRALAILAKVSEELDEVRRLLGST